ncbi:AraC family transcriptional regulator [uncultured Faecalibaculum sp.]|uniref:helix-turn-helix domain-containing protein n=1 Tax=uncultured Faecalibaculum sp. TaxID=1729681 RepID=UPI002607A81C|nr:AraC family transcriptional regulator [uncultured Faecalibaculum sp.]
MKKTISTLPWPGISAECFRGITQSFPAHFHEELVIGLMEEGTRTLICGSSRMDIQSGDLFMIPCWCAHACYCAENHVSGWRVLRVDSAWRPARILNRKRNLSREFLRLHDRLMNGSADSRELSDFLARFKEAAGTAPDAPAPAALDLVKSLQICSSQRIHLSDLPALCGYSAASAQRILSAHTGLSVHQALTSLRVQDSRRLLENGLSLSRTAMEAGFADQPHFTNQFAAVMGITPGKWISQRKK